MQLLSATELNDRIISGIATTLIDIREPYEFDAGSICKVNIPFGQVIDRRDEFIEMPYVVLFCRSGQRADALVDYLNTTFSMANVYSLEGGLIAYAEAFQPDLEIE